MKNQKILFLILGFVIIAAAAFFGGMKYQQSKNVVNLSSQFGGNQNFGMMGQGNSNRTGNLNQQGMMRNNSGSRPINGEIINTDDKSITVKMTDGSSKIIFFSDKTTINKASEANKADLKTGEKVMVIGQQNTDGSVIATNISLNPIMKNSNQPTPAKPNGQ